MEIFLYIVLALLAALACCDLFVGVSNDAVNFLNSAVGSRTAPFWVILAVASAGVLLGATFSSGMMEIAKTGVFVPEMLTFHDVMVIFCAVIVTDVLLLNTFNSLGLPTSTTVSIVFELLGGTLAVACWKIWSTGAPMTEIGQYVNSAKALAMIMGILVSVIVAFFSGLVVQYVLRLIFTFQYQRIYRWLGGIYGSVCLTAILYFLVMKGAKGASFMQPEWIDWIDANTGAILVFLFLFWFAVFQAAISFLKLNIFPFIILSGTFALAFAFAGNDLVNFVGVPIAALDSFNIFVATPGADPSTMTMGALREVKTTPTILLALSGIVMCLTLWFSKKAHRVIRTSVNLSSSSRGGKEQFGSSLPARIMVRSSLRMNKVIHQIIPKSVFAALDTRFVKPKVKPGEIELPFDELRASVNLVLAAALIASATSMKLPLSTTYVTFMVAMGSSLSDRAWDRESAVYRISGVLTVISGWFLTAFSAATACGFVASVMSLWEEPIILVGMITALAVIIRTNFFSKDDDEKDQEEETRRVDRGDQSSICELMTKSVGNYLDRTLTYFAEGLEAFLREDHQELARVRDDSIVLMEEISARRSEYYSMAVQGGGRKRDRDARNFYYRAFTNMKEVSHSLRDQMGVADNYVANSHSPFTGRMRDSIILLAKEFQRLRTQFSPQDCTRILGLIEEAQANFLVQIGEEHISLRKSELYLGFLLFAREVLNRFMMVKLLQTELETETAKTAAEDAERQRAVEAALAEGKAVEFPKKDEPPTQKA
ncbi:inorganic phosphate transporter [Sutterella sp.]|uniref:inorganic phosphate transporter n=1 Tax=Sutterella sp. TaxID=1981025 RepID=UPI0026DF9156|nr:inorganic phosphate transporter [Sutterella sp.]MDO5532609.1 inorganic phosphate transporter [Sutterella sp.]